ncbi:MAG: cyclic nucleotide-binding domain-containing protein [Geminicoccaceae bacterium]|nr:cyclic nucleotide-binding domain-containing protein [Geminicoccaceae bacterium]
MAERFEVAILGSGPAGLSAAARAAERGLSHVVLERHDIYAQTIQRYQKGKYVMATPDNLPLRSDIGFEAGTREEILGVWGEQAERLGINLRCNANAETVEGSKGGFRITLRGGEMVEAAHVVMAIGDQGELRKVGVPGDDLPCVQYQLDDPEAFAGETIVVIGGGDSAIENAVALARQNRVYIAYRRAEWARAKSGNITAVEKAAQGDSLDILFSTSPERIEPGRIILRTPEGSREIAIDRVIARLGGIPPRGFLERCGIRFPADRNARIPELSVTYETNVEGLYVIGAPAGAPVIKQCMNQGYEVIETISGHPVEPADQPILAEKLAGLPGRPSVDEALVLIRDQLPLFDELTTLQLREFLLDSDTHLLFRGEPVTRTGGRAGTILLIGDGIVQLDLTDKSGATQTVTRTTGDFIGDVGFTSGQRRTSNVRAATDCVLIEMARRSVIKLLASSARARSIFERTIIIRQLQDSLSGDLSEADLQPLIDTAEVRRFTAGDLLIREGTTDDQNIYFIRSGSVTISSSADGRETVFGVEPAGSIVGEMALLYNRPRTADVTASVDTEALLIDGAAFKPFLDARPDLRVKIDQAVHDRVLRGVAYQQDPWRGAVADFLVEQGIGEATNALLIDESLCVRCDNCEIACAETHDGIARLDREAGPTFRQLHVPISCRHCENPHCMADCPPNALHRDEKGEVWIDKTCIGCGNCSENCPYGVIRMAVPAPKKPGLLQWLLFGRGSGPGEDKLAGKAKKAGAGGGDLPKKAMKCDLCRGTRGGPACVRACPTGAAIRISPNDYFRSMTEMPS